MGDFPPYDPDAEDDDYDGLSALDYSYSDDGSYPDNGSEEDSVLDALGESFSTAADTAAAVSTDDRDTGLDAFDGRDEHGELDIPLFTVTNPPGTVTVTTYLDGRVQQIDLSPKVINMTETDLADEILVIAELAAQDARSAQYSSMLASMREHGHDDVATRDFLTRDLGLPSPEQADETRAQVFSTRYGADHG